MFPKNSRIFGSLIGLTFLAGAAAIPVLAQTTPTPSSPHQHTDFLKKLNLSPDQTQKIDTIRSNDKAQITQDKQALRQAEQQLQSLMAGTADDSQIKQQFSQVEALKQKLTEDKFSERLAIRDVLTPAQRQQLALLHPHREGTKHNAKPQQ